MQPSRQPSSTSVNFIGREREDIGLGEVARSTVNALQAHGITVYQGGLDATTLPHRINLVSSDMSNISGRSAEQRRFITTGRYTITQYYWELPRLLAANQPALELADEMWAATRYMQDIFAAATSVPVRLIPPPVAVTPSVNIQRSAFGLPEDRTLFYFNFNVTSSYARKNPEAVIEAFRRAFGTARADSPLLVIKAQFLEQFLPLYHHFKALVENVGGILINESLSRQKTIDLLACTDAYVSLHRAEGFGLGMAEAMLLQKPVIATMFSGNADFMTAHNSYPVPYTMTTVSDDDHRYQPEFAYIYEAGQPWAEPDIDAAAALMTRVYEYPDEGRQRGEQAASDITRQYAPEVVGALMAERLAAIDTSTLPDVLPPPTVPEIAPAAPPSRLKMLARELYQRAVPLPARLALRRIRRPDERWTPAAYTSAVRYQAVERLARMQGHLSIIVLGADQRDEIAALAQWFNVLVVDDTARLAGLADIPGRLETQTWSDPIPRIRLRRSAMIAHLDGIRDAAAAVHLTSAADVGALCIVSGTQQSAPSLTAFVDGLRGRGLPVWLHGSADGLYSAIVGTPEAPHTPTPPDYRVVAVMPAFNEADIIRPAIEYLNTQGVEVYVLDNHSTDGTGDIARSLIGNGVVAVETYPPENSGALEWNALLERIEQLSESLNADWVMFHDADEIRESFDPTRTLRDTLYSIDRSGYNAVNHSVLNFAPTDDNFVSGSDPRAHFRYREPLTQRDYSIQVKIWKQGRVNLTGSGGHSVAFADRYVFPFHFLMRHYPIRSQAHGERKIFRERKPRIKDDERARGWYSHVDDFAPKQSFVRDPAALVLVDDTFYEQFLLERLTGAGLYPADPDRPKNLFITSPKRRLPNA